MLRAGAHIDSGYYTSALRLLTALLDDPRKLNLRLDCTLAIADVFQRIDDVSQRSGVVEALIAVPRSRVYLKRFMHSPTFGSLLKPYEAGLDRRFEENA